MPDAEIPRFRVSNEGDPIPAVDPEELKRKWSTRKEPLTCDAKRPAPGEETDRAVALARRVQMIGMLAEVFNKGQLLAPWKHRDELDDSVFMLAATFPMQPLRQETYKVPGDSMWGFDPNAFVEKLIEETGISHTWETVLAKIPEGSGFSYLTHRVTFEGQAAPDPGREAKAEARELLWAVWSKCQPNISRPSPNHVQYDVQAIAMLFADFAIDNIHLAREFVSGTSARDHLAIVSELERRATWLDWLECSVCERLMRDHSDEDMARCQQALPPGTSLYRVRNS